MKGANFPLYSLVIRTMDFQVVSERLSTKLRFHTDDDSSYDETRTPIHNPRFHPVFHVYAKNDTI
jgi:hypothetical protein